MNENYSAAMERIKSFLLENLHLKEAGKDLLTVAKYGAFRITGTDKKTHEIKIKGKWVEIEDALKLNPLAYEKAMSRVYELPFNDRPDFYKSIALAELVGKLNPPKNKGGRPASEPYKASIAIAVKAFEFLGYKPTANDGTPKEKSGCGQVALTVYSAIEKPNDKERTLEEQYKSIKDIWLDKRNHPDETHLEIQALHLLGYRMPTREDFLSNTAQTTEDFLAQLSKEN